MEWEAQGIVIRANPFGEGDIVASVFTEEHGAHRGLVRGGGASRQIGQWEVGNIARVRWTGRTADQLGSFRGELISSPASRLMDDPIGIAAMSAACVVADGALAERAACPVAYHALLLLLAELINGEDAIPCFVRWELALLADLGFGLDLSRCAVTGGTDALMFVSPRSGRAVSAEAGAPWVERLLELPAFLASADRSGNVVDPDALLAGLRLTGYFLARDVFGLRHLAVPAGRARLEDLIVRARARACDGAS